ncbi:MAG TPA: hypothetical protein VM050_05785 [Patescibacteria group bacterium]|nr:hypothetical protein [Patescibacteria group bacterium]
MTRRGIVHTLDAFFAAVIIATALLYASQVPTDRDLQDTTPLAAWGMQALLNLDGDGTLGRLVHAESWDELESVLRLSLPSTVSFNLTVFDEGGSIVNEDSISNGGLIGRKVDSVDYMVAVDVEGCPLYRLRLQLGGLGVGGT